MINLNFIKAGNAIFTMSNPDGKRYTFKVSYSKKIKKHFAYVLTGSNNEKDYTYLGMMNNVNKIIPTKKSNFTSQSLPIRVINYAISIACGKNDLLKGYFLEHEGSCGRCGRTLTTPESIKSGLGPVCRNK